MFWREKAVCSCLHGNGFLLIGLNRNFYLTAYNCIVRK